MIHLPAIGRRFRSGIVCGLLGLWSAVAASAGSELIITNARVFDGRNAQLHENAEIVIAGGKIVAIRKAGSGLPEAGSTAAGADASRDAKAGSASAAGSAPRPSRESRGSPTW